MLWIDKYCPNSLSKMDYHQELSDKLKALAKSGDFPHLLMYGPSGSGRKTRVMALLRELYGPGVERMKVESRSYKTKKGTSLELNSISSNYHIEINASDAGVHDRVVIQEVLKEMAASHTLGNFPFKVVVLSEVDRLSKDAQHALRRTMEKYTATCRLILVSQSTCRVIEPIRSRCLGIRVASPTEDEIVSILKNICKKESLTVPDALALRVAKQSQRNLRRAILMMESCRMQSYPFSPDQVIPLADWELYIGELAKEIMETQTPKKLLDCRTRYYELLAHCIPPEMIIKQLSTVLMANAAEIKQEIATWAAFYEHRIRTGRKPIIHLEAFTATIMTVQKGYLNMLADMYMSYM